MYSVGWHGPTKADGRTSRGKRWHGRPPSNQLDEVWQHAQDKLRPHGDPPPELPPNAYIDRWAATDDQTRKAMLKLKPGKAATQADGRQKVLWAVVRLPRCRPLLAAWLTDGDC